MELNEENKKVVMNKSESEISKVSHYSGKKFEEKRRKFCSRNHRMVNSECPAWGKTCNSCHKPNHFAGAEVCESGKSDVKSDKSDRKSKGSADSSSGSKTPAKSNKRGKYAKKSVHMVDDEFSDSSTEGSVSVATDVSAVHNDKARPLFCKMKIDDNVVVHQIDPGATVCILPVKHVGDRPIRHEPVTLKMWNGASETALGKVKIKVTNLKTKK